MARPAIYPWERILSRLAGGESATALRDEYSIPKSTWYAKLRDMRSVNNAEHSKQKATPKQEAPRTRAPSPAAAPASPQRTFRLVQGDKPAARSKRGGTAPPRETSEERSARMSREAKAARQRQADERLLRGAAAGGLSKERLKEVVGRLSERLLDASLGGETKEIRDLTAALTQITDKLGAILAAEETLQPSEPEVDHTTEEGRRQMAAQLAQMPGLLSFIPPDVLESAAEISRDRLRREA